jgi:hypothetical protein
MKRTAFIIGMVFIAASAIAQNADFYLQIQQPGRFEVRLGDEVQISSRGRFRFFDMNGGLYVLNVYRGNFQLYSGQVQLIPNQTIIAELNQGRLFFQNQQGSWGQPTQGGGCINSAQGSQTLLNLISDADYLAFRQLVSNQSFDSNKGQLIRQYVSRGGFRSAQVADLLTLMSFDSSKLETAKFCYLYVADPAAYFRVYEVFSFSSSVSDLSNYIASL